MHFIDLDGVVKTFGRNLPLLKLRSFLAESSIISSVAKIWSGSACEQSRDASCCRSKQIVVLLDRFSHAQTDAQVQRRRGILNIEGGKCSLNGYGAFESLVDRRERGHDSIPEVLDLSSGMLTKCLACQSIVNMSKCKALASPNRMVIAVESCRSVNMMARAPASRVLVRRSSWGAVGNPPEERLNRRDRLR